MVLSSLRRRLLSTLGRPPRPEPMQALLALLRAGRTDGPAYIERCVELGLGRRAREALQRQPGLVPRPSTRIRLALVQGDLDQALACAQALLDEPAASSVPRSESMAVVDALAPVSAQACLQIIRRHALVHAAEPALRAQLGDADGARTRAAELGRFLGPDAWLLTANLGTLPGGPLAGLNAYLGEHGLSPATLIDPDRALSVNNLHPARAGTASAPMSTTRSARSARLSVVMTAHQSATHVDAAIRSVLQSAHADLQLIVVDDGSSDGTWARVCALATRDGRIRPVRIGGNVGTYAAKNLGLGMADGDYAAFQDADDWSHPDRFAHCIAALQQDARRIAVSAHYVRLDDGGSFRSSKVWPLTRWTPNSLVFRRAAVIERIGFFDENRFGSDSEYVSRLRAAFGPHAYRKLALPLIVAAHRPQSLMTATATGVDAQGLSRVRSDFQEGWTEALLQRLLAGSSLHRAALIGTRQHLDGQLQFG